MFDKKTKKKLKKTEKNKKPDKGKKSKKTKKILKKEEKKGKLKLTKDQIIKKINKSLKCDFLTINMNIKKIGEGVSNYVVSGCIDDKIEKDKCRNKIAFRLMGVSTNYPNDDNHRFLLQKFH